jgi:hypothetical protein
VCGWLDIITIISDCPPSHGIAQKKKKKKQQQLAISLRVRLWRFLDEETKIPWPSTSFFVGPPVAQINPHQVKGIKAKERNNNLMNGYRSDTLLLLLRYL